MEGAGELVGDDQLAQAAPAVPQPPPRMLLRAELGFSWMERTRKFRQRDKQRHEVRGCKAIWEHIQCIMFHVRV